MAQKWSGKRYKCGSTTLVHWNNTWTGLKSTWFKEDGRNQTVCYFFHFSGCHSKISNLPISQNFQTDESKCTYILMRMRKTTDNIAQVVRMNFNKNSTPKFNLDIKNVFIPLRHDKGLKNIQTLFVAKVWFLHRYSMLISDVPCFAFQDQIPFLSSYNSSNARLGFCFFFLSLFYFLLPLQHQRTNFNQTQYVGDAVLLLMILKFLKRLIVSSDL